MWQPDGPTASMKAVCLPGDYAAGLLLIQEAGGTVTDLAGRALDCTVPSSVLASNGLIHRELEAILSPGPQGIGQDADQTRRG